METEEKSFTSATTRASLQYKPLDEPGVGREAGNFKDSMTIGGWSDQVPSDRPAGVWRVEGGKKKAGGRGGFPPWQGGP